MKTFKISVNVSENEAGPVMAALEKWSSRMAVDIVSPVPYDKNKPAAKKTRKPRGAWKPNHGSGRSVILNALEKAGEAGILRADLRKIYTEAGFNYSSLFAALQTLKEKKAVRQVNDTYFKV